MTCIDAFFFFFSTVRELIEASVTRLSFFKTTSTGFRFFPENGTQAGITKF